MRAKLKLESVIKTEYGEKLKFNAVPANNYDESGMDEDNTYAKFSPTATFEIQVANPELFGKFNPGEKYYFDVTKANK